MILKAKLEIGSSIFPFAHARTIARDLGPREAKHQPQKGIEGNSIEEFLAFSPLNSQSSFTRRRSLQSKEVLALTLP